MNQVLLKNYDWRECILSEGSRVQDALECLNKTAKQIILIVDSSNLLKGTVTDGDIRRGILRGVDTHHSIAKIMNKSPVVVSSEMSRDVVRELMDINKLRNLPIVDRTGRPIGIHFWDEMNAMPERDTVMVLMAGGLGKRLRPYTENVPKPMVDVNGKPMLEHIINHAKLCGIKRFVITLGYLGEVIKDYFQGGESLSVEIKYVEEKNPLGTAGALSLIGDIIFQNEVSREILVSNGDVMTMVNYGEIIDYHLHNEADATMAVKMNEWQYPFGVIKTNGLEIVEIEEKPIFKTYVNSGIYVLSEGLIKNIKKNTLHKASN
jgi:choline kinase